MNSIILLLYEIIKNIAFILLIIICHFNNNNEIHCEICSIIITKWSVNFWVWMEMLCLALWRIQHSLNLATQ